MKSNKGITMVALVLTIIILLILAGISIGTWNNVIEESNLENIKTNMLLIEVKAKELAQNANFNLGTSYDSIVDETQKNERLQQAKLQLKGEIIENINEFNMGLEKGADELEIYYKLSSEDINNMGITNIKSDSKNGWYIVKYNIRNIEVEIYNTKGFEVENKIYYSLTDIQRKYNKNERKRNREMNKFKTDRKRVI